MNSENKYCVYGRCMSVADLQEVCWNYNAVADGIYKLAQETGIFDETNCVIKSWRILDIQDTMWDSSITLIGVNMWNHAEEIPVQLSFPAQFLFMNPEEVKAIWAEHMNKIDEQIRTRIRESKRKQYEELKKLFEPEESDGKIS